MTSLHNLPYFHPLNHLNQKRICFRNLILQLRYFLFYNMIFLNSLDVIDGVISSVGSVKLWTKDSLINTNMSKGDFCIEHCQVEQGIPECQFIWELSIIINRFYMNASSPRTHFLFAN